MTFIYLPHSAPELSKYETVCSPKTEALGKEVEGGAGCRGPETRNSGGGVGVLLGSDGEKAGSEWQTSSPQAWRAQPRNLVLA